MITPFSDALLMVIDIQARLMPAIDQGDTVAAKSAKLIRGWQLFELPLIATEQYPKGLGSTVANVAEALGNTPCFAKTAFDCMADDDITAAVLDSGKKDVLLCGAEAHVCVQQTAWGLMQKGYTVHICEDAVGSRFSPDKQRALERLQRGGADITTTEAVLFEICGDAKHPKFKALSALVKA